MESKILVLQGMVNMIHTFGAWGGIIPESSLATTIDYVVTGGTINDANLSKELLSVIDTSKNYKILDFGCGIGRNAIPLAITYTNLQIYGYDNPKMINQMKQFCEQKYSKSLQQIKNLEIITDWSGVKKHKFDYIYATLVFQHISEHALSIYLQDIKNLTNYLIVGGRRFNDDGYKNTWEILEKNGLYPINTDSYRTHGDNNEHQLAIYKIQ